MKLLKNWTKFERTFLCISIFSISLVSILFQSDILTIACSIVGIIAILLIAKGKNSGQIWGILYTILYSIVSFRSKYYGEVFIYILFMLPMFIAGIIAWIKHKNTETDSVEINGITKKEWFYIFLTVPIIFVGIYFLLKLFHTEELILSAVSAISSLLGIYLQIRRARSSFVFYMLNDILLILLWGLPVLRGNYILLPMFLNVFFLFIDDIYGLYNWNKLMQLQRT